MDPRTCPICRRTLTAEAMAAPYRPFCSARCKTADLGGWLAGQYRISRPVKEEDLNAGTALPTDGTDADERRGQD